MKAYRRMSFHGLIGVFALSTALVYAAGVHAADPFTLNTADKPPYSTESNSGFYDLVLKEAFRGVGKEVAINHLPSARSIENVKLGIDDGEYARIRGMEATHEGLLLVDEPLVDFSFTAFAKRTDIVIKDWKSLAPYNVAFIRGWKIYEENVTETRSRTIVSDESELFGLLVNDRVDVILYERLRGADFMLNHAISGIHPLQAPLSVRPMFLYLNKKHNELVKPLADEIRKMKASGRYQSILNQFLK